MSHHLCGCWVFFEKRFDGSGELMLEVCGKSAFEKVDVEGKWIWVCDNCLRYKTKCMKNRYDRIIQPYRQ